MEIRLPLKKCFDIFFAKDSKLTALKWKRQNENKVANFHNQRNLRFKVIPIGRLESLDKTMIHHSPSRHGLQGSRYYIAIIDGRPAYVRVSNHWGNFATRGTWNDSISDYDLNSHNWELEGGKKDKDGYYQRVSQAGYIFLE